VVCLERGWRGLTLSGISRPDMGWGRLIPYQLETPRVGLLTGFIIWDR